MAERKSLFIGEEDAPAIYTNSVNVRRSTFDVQMVVGLLLGATDQEITTKVLTKIYMSPQHAKSLAQALSDQVRKYELTFGPITVEPIARREQAASHADAPESGDPH